MLKVDQNTRMTDESMMKSTVSRKLWNRNFETHWILSVLSIITNIPRLTISCKKKKREGERKRVKCTKKERKRRKRKKRSLVPLPLSQTHTHIHLISFITHPLYIYIHIYNLESRIVLCALYRCLPASVTISSIL